MCCCGNGIWGNNCDIYVVVFGNFMVKIKELCVIFSEVVVNYSGIKYLCKM